jgi:hypothetical protein
MCVYHRSATPVQGYKVPCQRTAHDGNMDEFGRRTVLEVRSRQVEEIDDEQQFRKPEVAADPKMDESEDEEVVEDKVRSYRCGSFNIGVIIGV